MVELRSLDLLAVDRLLAVPHRDDDQPCSCDECMAYGAEDAGADWFRMPVANRIAIRILDGADSRFADLAEAFAAHDAALAADPPPERPYVAPPMIDWQAVYDGDEPMPEGRR